MRLHNIDPSHSFVDWDAIPGRQQRSAHPHRTDGPCLCFPAGPARLDPQPLEQRPDQQRSAGSDQRTERAAGGTRSGAWCVGHHQQHQRQEMTRARLRALWLVAAILIAAAAIGVAVTRHRQPAPPPRPAAQRPTLLLLTSLPLIFGEGFSLEGGGSPALKALNARYKVVPISVTDGAELAKGRLLLMAQPLAQTAENLVVLDSWVRMGGRVLLFADPMLEWPSKLPLGDPL